MYWLCWQTPLHYAAYGGHSECVLRLIAANAIVDVTDVCRKRDERKSKRKECELLGWRISLFHLDGSFIHQNYVHVKFSLSTILSPFLMFSLFHLSLSFSHSRFHYLCLCLFVICLFQSHANCKFTSFFYPSLILWISTFSLSRLFCFLSHFHNSFTHCGWS